MRAYTFGLEVGPDIEVEIISGPTSTGLCIVTDGKNKYVRHVDRLVPIDEEAKEKLGKLAGRDFMNK